MIFVVFEDAVFVVVIVVTVGVVAVIVVVYVGVNDFVEKYCFLLR